jgi:hypothetical protein
MFNTSFLEALGMKRFRGPTSFVVTLAVVQFVTFVPITEAQVVQLPSARSLSYSGSVLVPDGGTASLGGASYSRYGSRQSGWGPMSSGSSASGVGSSSMAASVNIIDLAAMDEAILGAANSRTTTTGQTPSLNASNSTDRSAANLGEAISPASVESSTRPKTHATTLEENASVRVGADPGKWQRVLSGGSSGRLSDPTLLESDIRYYLMRGEAAEQAGSLMAARVYYKMARDLMTPELVERYQRILAERKAAEEARLKAELEFARRKF